MDANSSVPNTTPPKPIAMKSGHISISFPWQWQPLGPIIILWFTSALLPRVTSLAAASAKSIPFPNSQISVTRGLLDRVRHNDRAGAAARSALPFVVGSSADAAPVGLVLPQAAEEFAKFPSVFSVTDREMRLPDKPTWLNDGIGTLVSERSIAVQEVLETMRKNKSIPALNGWRDEKFAVRESFHSPPQLIVERSAAVLFGVPSYGVFVNGYTCEGLVNDCPTHVWIGKRSSNKPTWPGRLDSLAAGGLAAGMLPRQAMVSECIEEAGINKDYADKHMIAASAVSYTGFNDDKWGLKRDVLFCFDLQVPNDFEPVPVDGEMESFKKVRVAKLIELLREPILEENDSDNLWKPNVGVVLIDFLLRRGMLDADDPSFLELAGALRGAKCA